MSPRQSQTTPSPEQAAYIVGRLLSERRVSPRDITTYLGDLHEEIRILEARVSALRSIAGGAGDVRKPAAAATVRRRRGKAPTSKAVGPETSTTNAPAKAAQKQPKRQHSPETLASYQLQGRFIRALKKVPLGQRDEYKRLAKEKGREAAVKEIEQKFR